MDTNRSSALAPLLALLLVLLLVLIGIGTVWYYLWGPGHDAEAKAIRRLAEGIPGVTVHEVDGIDDFTLENIWLDLEYQGERFIFCHVTTGSFEDTGHLWVSRAGSWTFSVYGFERGHEPSPREGPADRCYTFRGTLDFGEKGDVGAGLHPPIRSIPEFLARLTEVRQVVGGVPVEFPGVRIGEDEHVVTIMATGKQKRTPLWSWAVRSAAD